MVTDDNLATLRRWIAMADAGFAGDFLDIFTPPGPPSASELR